MIRIEFMPSSYNVYFSRYVCVCLYVYLMKIDMSIYWGQQYLVNKKEPRLQLWQMGKYQSKSCLRGIWKKKPLLCFWIYQNNVQCA